MNPVVLPIGYRNLWDLPNLLLQKLPAERFEATAKIHLDLRNDGERFGIVVMGLDYSYIAITKHTNGLRITHASTKDADKGAQEVETPDVGLLSGKDIYLRITIENGGTARCSFSRNGLDFTAIGPTSTIREGRWIGAKLGFFFTRQVRINDGGSVDLDWIRFRPISRP